MTNRTYDVTLSASIGATAQVSASGTKVKIITAPGGAVGVKVDGGPEYTLSAGQGFRLRENVTFRDVAVRNLTANAQTVTLFIGDSFFDDTTISGSVKVIDSSADKTGGLNQFLGATAAPASVGNGSACFVGNNGGGSGVVVVRRLLASASVNCNLWLMSGTLGGSFNPAGAMANKSIGGAGSAVARLGTFNPVGSALPGAGEVSALVAYGKFGIQANAVLDLRFDVPIILRTASRCFGMTGDIVNMALNVTFEAEELVY